MNEKNTFALQCMIRKGRKNRKDQYPVFMRLTVDGRRAEIATNIVVDVNKWNATKGRLSGTMNEVKRTNRLLENFELKARETYNRYLMEGKMVTAAVIKSEINGTEHRVHLLLASFEKEVQQMQLREGNGFTRGTIKNWQVTLRHLGEYVRLHYKITDIPFRQLDVQFLIDFDWFARTKWNCRTNAVLKHIQRLQKVIRIAINKGWLNKNPFNTFHLKPERTHRTFLTADELMEIEAKEFSLQRLQIVKDIFIFSCYTGLAFVDIEHLTDDNIRNGIDGKKWVFTYRQKTDNKSNIPLLPQALRIMHKYKELSAPLLKGKLLPTINNSKTNAYLKEIADLCGIQKNLTFHMARHTFATTVTLSNGAPIETISNLLGHTKISEDMKILESRLNSAEH
jgi:integrase